jgi:hypothetical protein
VHTCVRLPFDREAERVTEGLAEQAAAVAIPVHRRIMAGGGYKARRRLRGPQERPQP